MDLSSVSILAAQFPVLHLGTGLTCCCASLRAPYGTISPSSISEQARTYCSIVYDETSTGIQLSDEINCNESIVSSVLDGGVEGSFDMVECERTVSQGMISRLSYAIETGELALADIRINDEELQFVIPHDYHTYVHENGTFANETALWAEAFCKYHNVFDPGQKGESPPSSAGGASCTNYLYKEVSMSFDRSDSIRHEQFMEDDFVVVSPSHQVQPPSFSPTRPEMMQSLDASVLLEAGGAFSNGPINPKCKIYLHHYHDFCGGSQASCATSEDSYRGEMKREFEMITSGITNQPNCSRTSELVEADIIICMMPTEIIKSLDKFWWCPSVAQPASTAKYAVLDMTDRPVLSELILSEELQKPGVKIFKRSFVIRATGESLYFPDYIENDNIVPLPLSSLPGYTRSNSNNDENSFQRFQERKLTISCTLRPTSISRAKTLGMVEKAARATGVMDERIFLGQLDDGVRTSLNEKYSRMLQESQIIVTSNPPNWEGDHRTFESLSSGALVFIDRASSHTSLGLIDGVNCVLFDLTDYNAFERKISFFINRGLQGLNDAHAIATEGKKLVEMHHQSKNRIERIITEFAL